RRRAADPDRSGALRRLRRQADQDPAQRAEAGGEVQGAGGVSTAALQRRLIIVLAINGVAALVAIAGIVGGLAFHVGWMNWLFVGALIVGFGAQIWLIVRFVRDKQA